MAEKQLETKEQDSMTLDEDSKGSVKARVHFYRVDDETDEAFATRTKQAFQLLKRGG